MANDVANEKKVASFLTLVDPKVYGLAKNLLSPKHPVSCSYDEIKDALKAHYKPKVIVDNFNISLFPRERALPNNQQTLKRC